MKRLSSRYDSWSALVSLDQSPDQVTPAPSSCPVVPRGEASLLQPTTLVTCHRRSPAPSPHLLVNTRSIRDKTRIPCCCRNGARRSACGTFRSGRSATGHVCADTRSWTHSCPGGKSCSREGPELLQCRQDERHGAIQGDRGTPPPGHELQSSVAPRLHVPHDQLGLRPRAGENMASRRRLQGRELLCIGLYLATDGKPKTCCTDPILNHTR